MGWGENRRQARRFVDRDRDSLTGKAHAAPASKPQRGFHSLLPIGRQMSRHLLESKTSAQVPWKEKRCDHEHPCFLLLPLSFYCWAQWRVVWKIPLVSLGWLSRPCPLSASCPPPGEEVREPQRRAGTVQQGAQTLFKCPSRPGAKSSCITYKQLVFSCSVVCHNSMRCNTRNFPEHSWCMNWSRCPLSYVGARCLWALVLESFRTPSGFAVKVTDAGDHKSLQRMDTRVQGLDRCSSSNNSATTATRRGSPGSLFSALCRYIFCACMTDLCTVWWTT